MALLFFCHNNKILTMIFINKLKKTNSMINIFIDKIYYYRHNLLKNLIHLARASFFFHKNSFNFSKY